MHEHEWKKADHIEPHEYIYMRDDPGLVAAINTSNKWKNLEVLNCVIYTGTATNTGSHIHLSTA